MRICKSILILATSLLVWSCDTCKYLECASDDFYGNFRIVSVADGSDLLFGPNRRYDQQKIRFFSIKGTDTAQYKGAAIRYYGNGFDSVLSVPFYPRADTIYIHLGNGDVDTLKLSFSGLNTRCCGYVSKIANFRFNDQIDLPGSTGLQELKK